MNNKAQITIFVIIAIVLVGGILAYFTLRDNLGGRRVPVELEPVYEYYLECLEETTRDGIRLLGEQGGYIETPEFEPGSSFMPFSNQLDFFGQGVPYWLYISGNNLLKEQVPSKSFMESELSIYVGEHSTNCNFDEYVAAGFDIYVEEGSAKAVVNDLDVVVSVDSSITIFKGNISVNVRGHEYNVNSKLGKFFGLAIEVYNYEKGEKFLEKYTIDVMRLYAPVDGIEISCAPKIFIEENIKQDIMDGISVNIPTLKIGKDYYDLSSEGRKYFVSGEDLDIDENVNFMFSSEWPSKIEIYGDLVNKPIGLQEGMSILGFCYVPYHLVYDIMFPVMIQFYDSEELFQFPIAVVIDKSQAREALPSSSGISLSSEICSFADKEVLVSTFDTNLEAVPAQISFKCLDDVCNIGETVTQTSGEASLIGEFPGCVNGFIVARAQGYADSKYQISTNSEIVANIIMDKKYSINLDLGRVDKALVTFDSVDYTTTILYPDFLSIELIEGLYNISVTVYDNSSLKFPATSEEKCVDVPASGALGYLGKKEEKCFDISLPETDITFAIVGGGKAIEYITAEELEDSVELNINVPLFGVPTNLDELQKNQIAAEDERIILEFE